MTSLDYRIEYSLLSVLALFGLYWILRTGAWKSVLFWLYILVFPLLFALTPEIAPEDYRVINVAATCAALFVFNFLVHRASGRGMGLAAAQMASLLPCFPLWIELCARQILPYIFYG